MFLLSAKCDAPKQCWWQVLRSLNITVVASLAHSARKIPLFLSKKGPFFIVRVVCHVGMAEESCTSLVLQNGH